MMFYKKIVNDTNKLTWLKYLFLAISIIISSVFLSYQRVYAKANAENIKPVFDSKNQLQEILTSSDYSTETKKGEWVCKPKYPNCDGRNNRKLTNDDKDTSERSSGFELFSKLFALTLKVISILFLLYLVYLLIKNSSKIQLFISRNFKRTKSYSIDDFRQAHLQQGWENLPEHTLVPNVVHQLLSEQNTPAAASIAYRASLRWLNQQYQCDILPAATEKVCLAQLKNMQSLKQTNNIHDLEANYVSSIINLWLPIAYDVKNNNQAQYTQQLGDVINEWNQRLTLDKKSSNRAVVS